MNAITPTLATIPAELRCQTRWVVAGIEDRHGKATKVPYCPSDPTRRADTTDPSTWSDFETARQLVERGRFPMVGFVLGNGFVGVDLDKCRNPETGVVEPWAQDIVTRLDSYTEWSVSGTGIHIICRGVLPAGRRRKGLIEMYSWARYFVVTGRGAVGAIEDRTVQLAGLHAETFGSANDHAVLDTTGLDAVEHGVPAMTDDALLDVAGAAANSGKFQRLWTGDRSDYDSASEADLALCRLLAFYTQHASQIDRLFRRSGLCRSKWNRRDYRDRTIAKAVSGVLAHYEPLTEIPSLPLDPDAPTVDFDLDTPNLEAL